MTKLAWHENWGGSGLTKDQYADCLKANRSTKTGRRLRTSNPSPLEIKAKKVNWAKLQVKGAAIGMQQAIREMNLSEANTLELAKTIVKLKQLMLSKLTEGYELTKFEYWQEQASSKK